MLEGDGCRAAFKYGLAGALGAAGAYGGSVLGGYAGASGVLPALPPEVSREVSEVR